MTADATQHPDGPSTGDAITVADAASVGRDECLAGVPASKAWYLGYQHLVNHERGTRVSFVREPARVGVGESLIYEPRRFWIERDGRGVCFKEPSSISYKNSHHNWLDEIGSSSGSERFTLKLIFDFTASDAPRWKDVLSIDPLQGDAPSVVVPLRDDGCWAVPDSYEHCVGRTKINPKQ